LPLKTPALHKLTVNFRSHSEILNLANIIVDIILELFPTSIDRMKKEIAKEKGPKPIILNNEK
jgi:ATP-dependent exoDNAse (exonuclease V) beta subunit